jgi:hypothetical protein
LGPEGIFSSSIRWSEFSRAGHDLTYAPPLDADGVTCGKQTCAPGLVCCLAGGVEGCAQSCADGGNEFACDGPEDCMGNPCCTRSDQNVATCGVAPTDCQPTVLNSDAGFTLITRFCHVDGDCTYGAQNTVLATCCTISPQPGLIAHVCLTPGIAAMAGGACP